MRRLSCRMMLAGGTPVSYTHLDVYKRQMYALPIAEQTGSLPDEFSLVTCSHPNVLIETVKPAEDGDGIVLRLYESCGGRAKTDLCFGFPVAEVEVCDLLENAMKKAVITQNQIALELTPFEIATIKIKPKN